MGAKLAVPEALLERTRGFLGAEDLDLEAVGAGEAEIVVREGEGRQQADATNLYTGGWISCDTAWQVAESLKLNRKKMGRFLDLFDIRIRDCQLGCF